MSCELRASSFERDALAEVMYRGFLAIRIAGWEGDAEKAAAIADALHNVPYLLSGRHDGTWSVAELRRSFLDDLIANYPELAGLAQPLEDL